MFHHDDVLQNYITIICNEGRYEEIIDACDIYHCEFASSQEAVEWGISFGEHIGKYFYGEEIWRFTCPDSITFFYFIGTKEKVENNINNIL